MDDSSPKTTDTPQVPLPGMWELAWLLFMQPIRLHRLHKDLGLSGDPRLWSLRHRLTSDATLRRLLLRYAAVLAVLLPLSLLVAGAFLRLGGVALPRVIAGVAVGAAFGVAVGVSRSIVFDVAGGVAVGVAYGVAVGVAYGVTIGVAYGVAYGVTVGLAGGVTVGLTGGVAVGVALREAYGIARFVVVGIAVHVFEAVVGGVVFGVSVGIAVGVAVAVALPLPLLPLPTYTLACVIGWALMAWARGDAVRVKRVVPWLPFQRHDLLWGPLPGLRTFLIDLAEMPGQEAMARSLLADCAQSLGQKKVAQAALREIQARTLERAANQPDRYPSVKTLSLPFLPGEDRPAGSLFAPFQIAAGQLVAAQTNHNQHLRADNLRIARQALEQFLSRAIVDSGSDAPLLDRLQPVARKWLEVVQAHEQQLDKERNQRPELPMLFHQGNPLRPENAALFKGRTDIFRQLQEDLAAPGGAPVFLFGQRRVGKTSVVNFLPVMLGEARRVALVNFQQLSGSPHRAAPFHEIAAQVAKVWGADPPVSTLGWNVVLEWLSKLDEELAKTQERMLVAIDEVEAMDAVGPGRDDTLDFLRAAGDTLKWIRFLLVGARSPDQLGREWTRRLISAMLRQIDYLDESAARELLTHPSSEERYNRLFAELYPAGGIDEILAQTACQPCLLQHVMANLVSRLNKAQRLRADLADIRYAIDDTPNSASSVLVELWMELEQDAQQALRTLLPDYDGPRAEPKLLRQLKTRGYVVKQADTYKIRIPLFQRWLRQREEE